MFNLAVEELNFYKTETHGSGELRTLMVSKGFQAGDRGMDVEQAFAEGERHVRFFTN